MSLRTVLITLLVTLGALTTGLVGFSGAMSITRSVRDEAQQRVDKDLATIRAHLDERQRLLAQKIETVAVGLDADDAGLAQTLQRFRDSLGLDVLNVCELDGRRVAGGYPPDAPPVLVADDAIIRWAAAGTPKWGTVCFTPERLHAEGGDVLVSAARVSGVDGSAPVKDALLWWAASPLRDAAGTVQAIVYGGRRLNRNFALVDDVRDLAFGRELYRGKPRGTVTVFLNDRRVATNVLGPGGERAVNTVVSDEVRAQVLDRGEPWHGRAYVVDAWYLSAYEPLVDPAGRRIGMLYVGLLEAPYADARAALIRSLLLRLGLIALGAIALTVLLVNRITAPLATLSQAAAAVAHGDRDQRVGQPRSYAEIRELSASFREMQEAIAERDRSLSAQNAALAEANANLERANRNYMHTLGFVTHELKSPLAAMQSMLHVLRGGYLGDIPDKAHDFLARIQRNCEELQDMVKNYLDLSRAERNELTPHIAPERILETVVGPCAAAAQPLFAARGMKLDVACTDELTAPVDAELARIALGNLLSNAAKYGREGSTARLRARIEDHHLALCVWNAGDGFTAEEQATLFGKFMRLKNANTRGKHGSGLGLYLVQTIAEAHGGVVRAESEPGQWASFCMDLPTHNG
ncbi:MAG TPA: cache domain-containing protein [Phycisphaerae bacterium]|nr:cache domain-containing protein [Phycisphaerales bacterium]HRX85497.1 cache domain-containing protein [Phycisphaerae bacterium]